MESIEKALETWPDKITSAQVTSLNYYLEQHPRMVINSVWYDSFDDIILVCFASGLIMGIEKNGDRNT